VARTAIVMGRLIAESVKGVLIATAIVVLAIIFGISIAMEIAATLNPVTYVMEALRSLILRDLVWSEILPGFGVVVVVGALMLVLNVRTINNYD
jgi:ABC-type multidrug transport system permease subunit